ncbi:ABC transporter ATP-binding protein [Actinomyces radicidentis]|uniref:ABC transporter domain-containing protein n=1 Tax=Actinomyces radicidentis TaxID=111015 RepID=A0A0X8JCP6_ACTRD|nr:ABC transporter ATP-binding protein [Actinomyces radicidentis]AMD86454.1 hypothetical protein AXF14_01115 [Actinomyces radicidentis]
MSIRPVTAQAPDDRRPAPPRPVAAMREAAVRYEAGGGWVTQGITLDLLAGTTTLLTGPSGCGKSTVTRLLPGLVPHCIPSVYRGSVQVEGEEVADAEVAHLAGSVAVVMQDPDAQVVTTRVMDEVCYALENLRVPAAETEARARRALRAVGLDWAPDRSPWELSGGQRQRLVLACALAQGPALLVLDEPTANLDPASTAAFYGLLPEVRATGAAVLVVEHDLDDVVEHVDRVIALGADGDVLASGPTREVLGEHGRELARAGVRLPSATRLAHLLEDAGQTPLGTRPVPLTLAEGAELLSATPLPAPRGADRVGAPTGRAAAATGALTRPALEVNGLHVPRGGRRRRRPVLTGVDLEVPAGQVLALVGANGSGKTTLLRALAGLERWTAGSVRVSGRPRRPGVTGPELTLVPQNPEHQFLERTVHDELAHGLRLAGGTEDEIERSVSARLSRFALERHSGTSPFLLSGGQQRRLSVASVLGRHREVICLDEPTFGQDRRSCEALMELIHEVAARGTAIVLSTHDMELVAEHADLVAVLAHGSVLVQGRPRDVLTDLAVLTDAGLSAPPLTRMRARAVAQGAVLPDLTRWEDLS